MPNSPIPDVPFIASPAWTESAHRHAVQVGRLDRMQPGVLAGTLSPDEPRYARARAANLRRARAASLKCDRSALSHASGCITHDLPVLGKAVTRSCLTVQAGTPLRRLAKVHLHRASIGDILTVNGFPVTPIARSVLDLAREHGVLAGLAAADAALHSEVITRDELYAELAVQERWPGVRRARFVAGFADGRTESPLESLSRLRMFERRLPRPEPQVLICNDHGDIVTRADFYWAEFGVIGESDGAIKWEQDPAARDRRDAKTRLLEELGLIVVRWGWAEAYTFDGVDRRLRLGFARGARPGSPLRNWGVLRPR